MDMGRVGSFFVSDEFMRDDVLMESLQGLMAEVFICSAIHNFGYGRFEYIGFSKHFQVVVEGQEAPRYEIHSYDGDNARLTFVMV